MRELIFRQDEYRTLEYLIVRGFHYNTSNATLTREVKGNLGWELDVWCPQVKGYKKWFTEYIDLNLRVWYDDEIQYEKI